MSTRAMIAVQHYSNGYYELYYRHSDGYPTALGAELINALKAKRTEVRDLHSVIDEVLEAVDAKDKGGTVERIEDIFPEVQGDLEWVYVIEDAADLDRDPEKSCLSMTILKTSCPSKCPDFAARVWFSYRRFFPENIEEVMERVEYTGNTVLSMLDGYHNAHEKTRLTA